MRHFSFLSMLLLLMATSVMAQESELREKQRAEKQRMEETLREAMEAFPQGFVARYKAEGVRYVEQLDSIVAPGRNKSIFEYDSTGECVTNILQRWDMQSNGWVNGSKSEYEFKEYGKDFSYISYMWDDAKKEWTPSLKCVYAFDEADHSTLYEEYKWYSSSNEWIGTTKYEYAFENEKETLYATYGWNYSNKDWRCLEKYEYAYDANENKTLDAHYMWHSFADILLCHWKMEYKFDDDGTLLEYKNSFQSDRDFNWNVQKYVYSFDRDAAGRVLTKYIHGYYSDNSDTPDYVSKFEYTYDENGNMTSQVEVMLREDTWNYLSKYEYTYDEKGYLTFETYSSWNTAKNDWMGVSMYECKSDESGNMTQSIFFMWDNSSNKWEPRSKSEYAYDEKGNRILEVTYDTNGESHDWRCLQKYEYAFDNNGNKILDAEYLDAAYYQMGISGLVCTNKGIWAYDEAGHRTFEERYSWDFILEALAGVYKSEHAYDDYGNNTLQSTYSWNRDNGVWDKAQETVYTFDYSAPIGSVAGVGEWSKPLENTSTVFKTGEIVKEKYYYSPFSPNAIQNMTVSAKGSKGGIYTLEGQKVNRLMPNRIYIKDGKKIMAR